MKENNIDKISKIFKKNKGIITRADINRANINSWFLSSFVRENNLIKIASGCYVDKKYVIDNYSILQKSYPKYIFSDLSALYLNGLTEVMPDFIYVAKPFNYHPSRSLQKNICIRQISNPDIYRLGICKIKTMMGNEVYAYDEHRAICDLIKYRNKYDREVFVKAIRFYLEKVKSHKELLHYARMIGIEEKVIEIMELLGETN